MKKEYHQNWEELAWFASTSTTQSTKTWLQLIKNSDELPDSFRSLGQITANQYLIYFPLDLNTPTPRPETLAGLSDSGIQVWIKQDETISQHLYKFDSLMWLEYGSVLLHSWVSIRDEHSSWTVMYNYVNTDLLAPLIFSARTRSLQMGPMPCASLKSLPASILDLEKNHFKLLQLSHDAIYQDAKIEEVYLQESIDNRGPFLVVLCDSEVLFCRHLDKMESSGKLEGSVITSIPAPFLGECSVVHREIRDVLSLPLLPEGNSGTFSFSKNYLEDRQILKILAKRLHIV